MRHLVEEERRQVHAPAAAEESGVGVLDRSGADEEVAVAQEVVPIFARVGIGHRGNSDF